MKDPIHLVVSVDDQRMDVFAGGELLKSFVVSTATKGVGFAEGSFRTPTGRFRIAEKIGADMPLNTIFKARVPTGIWDGGAGEGDLVLTRILRLDGMDEENANTMERYVYIHGTNREDRIGTPTSHGCICLKNDEMAELFELVEEGAEVVVEPPVRRKGKVIFIDCDSTVSSIEGIDELAAWGGPEMYREVVALTDAAMNGEVALGEVFSRRMEIIRPGRAACEAVAARYVETITPGAREWIEALKAEGWMPVILSGGFAPLIRPLARELGIEHVEAVPLFIDAEGNYEGYGEDYPTTRNLGKNEVIREWKAALLPERTAMMGDGISDLETKPEVDVFIGFGGVVARPRVKDGADYWVTDMTDRESLMRILSADKIG